MNHHRDSHVNHAIMTDIQLQRRVHISVEWNHVYITAIYIYIHIYIYVYILYYVDMPYMTEYKAMYVYIDDAVYAVVQPGTGDYYCNKMSTITRFLSSIFFRLTFFSQSASKLAHSAKINNLIIFHNGAHKLTSCYPFGDIKPLNIICTWASNVLIEG